MSVRIYYHIIIILVTSILVLVPYRIPLVGISR